MLVEFLTYIAQLVKLGEIGYHTTIRDTLIEAAAKGAQCEG
jgi:hypothetical protein